MQHDNWYLHNKAMGTITNFACQQKGRDSHFDSTINHTKYTRWQLNDDID